MALPKSPLMRAESGATPAKRRAFPAKPGDGTAQRTLARGQKSSATMQAQQAAKVQTKKIKRAQPQNAPQPQQPDTAAPRAQQVSPEQERGQSISQALMKGAAMVPSGSKGSQILQGLLGGASAGMDIDMALQNYRMRKQEDSAANAVTRAMSAQQAGAQAPVMPAQSPGQRMGAAQQINARKPMTKPAVKRNPNVVGENDQARRGY